MHRLRDVIHRLDLISAAPADSVYDVAVTMCRGRVGAIPIVDGEQLVGIFSERDLMTRVVVTGRDSRATPVSEVMTHEVATAGIDDTVAGCLDKMRRVGCRHLPVLVDGRVICVVSMRDLLRDEIEEQQQQLRDLRARTPPPGG